MITIAKTYRWSASHVLVGLAEDHPCGRLHGHNYQATFTLTGTVDPATGFVLDYNDMDAVLGTFIDAHLDHRHLNDTDLLNDVNPTAEHIAHRLAHVATDRLPRHVLVVAVEVRETDKTAATWTR